MGSTHRGLTRSGLLITIETRENNRDGNDMKQWLKKVWLSLKIEQKIKWYTGFVLCIILLSIFLAGWAVKVSLLDFYVILDHNSLASDFLQCMETESDLFVAYAKNGGTDIYRELEQAIKDTEKMLTQLPYGYKEIGEMRYARTWSIRNMYRIYCDKRDSLLTAGETESNYIVNLYEVYEIQDYLQEYARQLMRETLEDSVSVYEGKIRMMLIVPVFMIVTEFVSFLCIRKMSELLNHSIVSPVTELAEASRKIAENDFFIQDVKCQSEDEMGELIHAFNKMKYATGEYIMALEERRKALDLYHAEELEKLEIAGRLDAMELDLLKNQINPHFLFNTLNVIGGMANLEGAQTTESMIHALSDLFRYNLKTPEEEVSLARELKVVEDYMFLQEMRFGSRITYEVDCQVDAEYAQIPTFTFQPLIENAIIHGLAPKEEGGHILIRIRNKRNMLHIAVADNGTGMDAETLKRFREALSEEGSDKKARTNIGLFNLYKRIHSMYENGEMKIYSKAGVGTIISIRIPDRRGNYFGK